MNPYILLLIGLVLVFLEFYLPGAILGTIGGIFIVSSYIVMANYTSSLTEFLLFLGGSFIALYALIKFALWRIPRAKSGMSIYLKGDQEGYVASTYDKSAVGKTGIVLTDLKPGGYIIVDGLQHQALSLVGYIAKGEKVNIISGEGESLLVQKGESK